MADDKNNEKAKGQDDENFVATDDIYENYGGVSHQPFAGGGAEAEATKRIKESLEDIPSEPASGQDVESPAFGGGGTADATDDGGDNGGDDKKDEGKQQAKAKPAPAKE